LHCKLKNKKLKKKKNTNQAADFKNFTNSKIPICH